MSLLTQKHKQNSKKPITVYEITVFSMLGAIMYCSKLIMEWAPNIHLLGMFIISFTLVYRKKALIPIYVFVLITGILNGFSLWWVPYLYIWSVLWAITMILPRNLSRKAGFVIYPIICCLHGLLYGILYAPAQALMFGLDFRQMLAWIASGSMFDVMHAVGNFFAGFLVVPMKELLLKINRINKYG